MAAFQHAPLSISNDVRALEHEHNTYEDLLAFLASKDDPAVAEEDPRHQGGEGGGEETPNPTEFVKFDTLEALRAHSPNLIEHSAMSDKHVSMLKDDVRGEVWFVAKMDDHIMPKHTVLGGYGGGNLSARNPSNTDVVPFCLPHGDKSMIQVVLGSEEDTKNKPKTGTLYALAKPLEKKAAQKGAALTITAYGKLMAEGAAGKHQFNFEFPSGHAKHAAMDFFLASKAPGKTGAKNCSSGNFFASLAGRDAWEGPLATMWRFSYDSVRHILTARKPNVANKTDTPNSVRQS